MKVWEAHRDLSNSIGDSVYCDINTNPIPDGVRYSKELRDSYLYRAMLEINQQNLDLVKNVPNKVASILLDKLYSSLKTKVRFSLNGNTDFAITPHINPTGRLNHWDVFLDISLHTLTPQILYILDAYITDTEENIYRLPIKYGIDGSSIANGFNAQNPNPFLMIRSHRDNLNPSLEYMQIYDGTKLLDSNSFVNLYYIPTPKNPIDQNANEELYVDTMHINKMLSLAHFYSLIDSQDIENIEKFLPVQLKLQQQQ